MEMRSLFLAEVCSAFFAAGITARAIARYTDPMQACTVRSRGGEEGAIMTPDLRYERELEKAVHILTGGEIDALLAQS